MSLFFLLVSILALAPVASGMQKGISFGVLGVSVGAVVGAVIGFGFSSIILKIRKKMLENKSKEKLFILFYILIIMVIFIGSYLTVRGVEIICRSV